MLSLVSIALVALAAVRSVDAVASLTGDAEKDFNDASIDPVTGRPRNFGVVRVPDGDANFEGPDVGVPQQLQSGTISGWDIRAIYFQYDDFQDELLIGVDCYGICGDADGDGNPDVTSAALLSLGGQDMPDLARGEGLALVLDFDLNVADVLPSFVPNLLVPFDFVIGVPAGQPAEAVENASADQVSVLPCSRGRVDNERLNMGNCFGVYEYQDTTAVALARRFLRPAQIDGGDWPVRNTNPQPDSLRPDLEWVIQRITDLRERKNAGFTRSNREPWTVLMQAFAGSFLDAGIGEDYLPSQTDFIEISFPCLELDACDVCLGDGNTCLDCAGIPNGPNIYDACDVCGGDDSSCADCAGTPNGVADYDVCDVCDGDTSSCQDCAGTPNGAAVYDVCDVCQGDGSTCGDCAGVPNGAATYDVCDVCNGDGSTCLDCAGIPNGVTVYDICDVCGGDGTTCDDCAGVPLGTCEYDACDVCCGDGTTCLDCAGTPFGTCKYDNCGVCCGDGSSCVCLAIHKCPTVEVDHALLEWSIVATMDRIEHTVDVLEGIKAELCRYDVARGNLASEVAEFLGVSNSFREILENFCYVQIFFKETLEEALATTI